MKKTNQSLVHAESILKNSPSEFLLFMTDMLGLVNDENITIVKNKRYVFIRTITEIVISMMEKNSLSIVNGFEQIDSLSGPEGFKEVIGIAMTAVGKEMVETSISSEAIEQYTRGFAVLNLILKGVTEAHESRQVEKAAA